MDSDSSLSNKIFKNPIILAKILKKIEGKLTTNLEIRLVSQSFNSAYLEMLQKEHRQIKIEYIGKKLYETFTNPTTYDYRGPVENMWDNFRPGFGNVMPMNQDGNFALNGIGNQFIRNIEAFREQNIAQNAVDDREDEDDDEVDEEESVSDEEDEDEDEEEIEDEEDIEIGELEFADEDRFEYTEESKVVVYINHEPISVQKVDGYFKFLESVNVKVEKIYLKNVFKLRKACRDSLHNSIVNTLIGTEQNVCSMIGMSELCNGVECTRCPAIWMKCQEYGPICVYSPLIPREKKSFEKLVISDDLLERYSRCCFNEDEQQFYDRLKREIVSNIDCDTLILQLSESARRIGMGEGPLYNMKQLSLEALNLIIEIWNVTSIELKIVNNYQSIALNERWNEKEYLTKFRFNDPYESVKLIEQRIKIDRVVLDLTDSVYCGNGIIEKDTKWNSYKNIVSNIRRVFSTDNISISFSHWSNLSSLKIHTILNNILEVIFQENQRKLNVDIRYFATIGQFILEDDADSCLKLSEIPTTVYFKNYAFKVSTVNSKCTCYKRSLVEGKFVNEKWVGRTLKLIDSKKSCAINWEVLINENELSRTYPEETLKSHSNSYLWNLFYC